ncbi:MAG TPA: TetR/AcrR family transcriptional regulator [Zeimonas sp.]|nr:TetR/AcrR family transcriptional regulator [Zeimonas sp.]
MARTAGSDGARTHEAIRQAAIALIAERGFEAMTLRELAERVGLQPGSLYRYFPSKNRMLVELMVEHLEFLLAGWEREQPAGDDPYERLRAFVDFHIRSHTLRRREVFVANMELRSLSAPDRRRVVALRRRYEDVLTAILRAGVEGGAFHVPDPRIAAFAVLAMLTGVGTWFNDGGRLGKRELIDQYTRLVLQCVGAAPPPGPRAAHAPSPRRSH